ncbi:MAG TPA: hypothetical protein VIM61_13305 [Chthoniobacterales bacterium]
MTEKLHDISIDSPLTEPRREAITQFLSDNAHRFPMEISHSWTEASGPVLQLVTSPVTWHARFHDEKVEVFGSGPVWTRALLTKKRLQEVREHIEGVLRHAGFGVAGAV